MLNTLEVGTVIDSRYEIVERLGEGGIGIVFKARELGLERFVALKMLHPSLTGDSEHRARFKREGALLAALEHPHISRCFRFGLWKELFPYIAMEYLSGVPLTRVLGADGALETARVLSIGKQICDAMEYAHESKIIHRDLKPANIMLTLKDNQEIVKVLDFGLGRILPDPNQVSQHLTQTGDLIGSVYYMSPEQCLGKKSDARSDIYSLGCLLYETLTGAPPLVADTPVGLIHLHVNDYPAPLEKHLKGDVLPGLNSVLMRAMAKDPKDRYQSMSDLKSALSLVEAGRGDTIPAFGTGAGPVAVVRSRKVFAYLTGAIVVLAILSTFPFLNRRASVPDSSIVTSLAATSSRFNNNLTDSPLSKISKPPLLSSAEVKKLEQSLARLERYINSGKDTAPESSAAAIVTKLEMLEPIYWSQQRYDEWFALTERLLQVELIAEHASSLRSEELAEILEGTYQVSVKTRGLPDGRKWGERVRKLREQLTELESRHGSPQTTLTFRLTKSVQFAREGKLSDAQNELSKGLESFPAAMMDRVTGVSNISATKRIERTMRRLMESAVCKSPQDVLALCGMLLRLSDFDGVGQSETEIVREFCKMRLMKAFPGGKVPPSLRPSYDALMRSSSTLSSKSKATPNVAVIRDLVALPPEFNYWDAATRGPKIRYFTNWLDRYGQPISLASVRARCYLGLLYYNQAYDVALSQQKLAVTEFEKLARDVGTLKAEPRSEMEATGALIWKPLNAVYGPFVGSRMLLREYLPFLSLNQRETVVLIYSGYLSASGLYDEEEECRKQIVNPSATSRVLLARCLYRRRGAAYGGCGQIDIPDGRDIANWQATAPEALIEMGRLDDALSFVDAYKRYYDVQKRKLPYGNSLPVECSRSVFFRALILSLQEKNVEAERTIQVALRNAPSPYLYSFKVALLPLYIWNRGRRDMTIEPLLREFAPDSRDDISWLLPAAAGLRLVNPKVSRILLNRATDLLSVANAGKQSVEDVARTAELFTELGCAVQAKRILNQALEEGTTGADSFERVRIQLAFANLKQNNYRQAHEELDAVAERLVKPETLRQFLIAKAAISDGERNDSAAEKFYRRVYEMTRWSPRVEVMDKVFCLEKYAQFCNRIGKEDKAKSLHAEAESILPRRCREPWRTWKLVTPLFPYNRPLGLYDS